MDYTNFRSSVGGFRRSDVFEYIEKTAHEHRVALKALEKERDELQSRISELEAKQKELLGTIENLEAENQALTISANEQKEQNPVTSEDLDTLELAAYRRAEATERNAKTRAEKLRSSVQDLFETTKDQANQLDAEISDASGAIHVQMELLRSLSGRSEELLASVQKQLNELRSAFLEEEDE